MSDTTEFTGSACIDCVMLIANGDTSGNIHCETEEGEAAWLANFARLNDGIHWTVGDGESYFSWRDCSTCHSTLGGDRVDVIGWSTGH